MAPAALADAAREWLSDVGIPTATQLMHLLRHTSGLREYGSLPEYHEAVRRHADRPWTRDWSPSPKWSATS